MKRLVRVGVIDSGINPRHPQIGSVAGGVGIHTRDGEVVTDGHWEDALGHGTAVAATIRGHAPSAALYAIRIFRRRLSAHVAALLWALDWAGEQKLDVVCSSLGCANLAHRGDFEVALRESGLVTVAAASIDGAPSLPGTLPGVIRVAADPGLEEPRLRFAGGIFYASPWARMLGPLPKERNLNGTSLAVAHVTGRIAAMLASECGARPSPSDVQASLVASAIAVS